MDDNAPGMLARGSALAMDSLGISVRYLKEFGIVLCGPTHKWWLSARLLLGLSEAEALRMHKTQTLPLSGRQ